MSKSNPDEVSPAQPAQGIEPEITAQPKSIPDEIALEASAEPQLTIDVDDLGSHFLREATEQGDFDPERGWPSDANLFVSPAGDEPLGSSNFVAGKTVWEQTVDLETRTQGAANLLREPSPPIAADWDESLARPKANRRDLEGPKLRASGLLPAALRQCARLLRAIADRLQRSARTPLVPRGHASPSAAREQERMERKLDDAIEMTFPASDPISI